MSDSTSADGFILVKTPSQTNKFKDFIKNLKLYVYTPASPPREYIQACFFNNSFIICNPCQTYSY